MTELANLILEYVAIWGPSLVAIGGVIYACFECIRKMTTSMAETKKAVESLKENTTIKELTSELKKQSKKNERLQQTYTLLLDQLAKMKGYTDLMIPKDENEEE